MVSSPERRVTLDSSPTNKLAKTVVPEPDVRPARGPGSGFGKSFTSVPAMPKNEDDSDDNWWSNEERQQLVEQVQSNAIEAVYELLKQKRVRDEEEKVVDYIKDTHGKSLLAIAAKDGRCKLAKVLLHMKASIDSKDRNGDTPLSLAAYYGKDRVVELLLQRMASTENRSRALVIAAGSGKA